MQNTCAPFQGHFRLIQCSSLYFGNMMKLPEKVCRGKIQTAHYAHFALHILESVECEKNRWGTALWSNCLWFSEPLVSGVLSICVGVTVHSFGVESICLTKLCFGRQSMDPLLLSVRLKDCSRLREHPRREEDSSLRSHVNTQECRSVTTHN